MQNDYDLVTRKCTVVTLLGVMCSANTYIQGKRQIEFDKMTCLFRRKIVIEWENKMALELEADGGSPCARVLEGRRQPTEPLVQAPTARDVLFLRSYRPRRCATSEGLIAPFCQEKKKEHR